MIRLTAVKRPVLGSAGAFAIAAAGLLAVPPAGASAAASSTPTHSVSAPYQCDLTSYGDSTPLAFAGTVTVPTTAQVGSTVAVTFSTPSFTLPSSVPAVGTIGLSATSDAGPGSPATLQFTGQAAEETGATIPAITATASLTLNKVGTAGVTTPTGIVLTPTDSTGKPLTTIDCPTPVASIVGATITVTAAPTPTPTPTAPPSAAPPPASGPVYTCTVTGSGTQDLAFPISATATGPGRVGTTDLVTLSIQSPTIVGNVRLKTASQAEPTIDLKASLPMTGVQAGSIRVFGGNSINASTIKATGKLALIKAGTDKILLPPTFQVIGVAPGTTVTLLSCTLKTTDAVVLTLKVAGAAAHPVPEATGATPIGAPNTGGGGSLKAAFSVPQAGGGAAILLAGAGLALGAIRRRKKGPRTAA